MEVESASREEAIEKVTEICSKVLSNPVMEGYDFTLNEIKS